MKGEINVNGTVSWVKEIWHTGGYTSKRAEAQVTDPIVGRWIGWKVVVYNINNDTAVKMESYLDDKADNRWLKVTELTDNGRWYANSHDRVFYSAILPQKMLLLWYRNNYYIFHHRVKYPLYIDYFI